MSFPAPADPPSTSLPLPDPDAYPGEPREYARALMQRKDEMEKEMAALNNVLASHGSTPGTSLLDPEGYPRGDIDIYAIRHARAALARLTNDRRVVNDRLAGALEAAFAPTSSDFPSTGHPTTTTTDNLNLNMANGHDPVLARGGDMPDEWPDRAIARVNSVAPSSPAEEAGLRAGDMIHSFAAQTAASEGGLGGIGAVVARSEGRPLTILILRGSEKVRIRLTPRTGWGGRGSLGCHILPA